MLDRLETPRLSLRPFTPGDASAAYAWFSDPAVMRYTPTGPDRSLDETERRLARFVSHQNEHGFSKWIVLDRASGYPIGDAGLMVMPDYGFIDFGYRLAPAAWGRGLATEAASAWIDAAFHHFGLESLTAFAHPENAASLRILAKLGFVEQRRDVIQGMESVIFLLVRPI